MYKRARLQPIETGMNASADTPALQPRAPRKTRGKEVNCIWWRVSAMTRWSVAALTHVEDAEDARLVQTQDGDDGLLEHQLERHLELGLDKLAVAEWPHDIVLAAVHLAGGSL